MPPRKGKVKEEVSLSELEDTIKKFLNYDHGLKKIKFPNTMKNKTGKPKKDQKDLKIEKLQKELGKKDETIKKLRKEKRVLNKKNKELEKENKELKEYYNRFDILDI